MDWLHRLSETEGREKNYSHLLPFRNGSDRSGLYSKLPDMHSVGDISLNMSLRKSKREKDKIR